MNTGGAFLTMGVSEFWIWCVENGIGWGLGVPVQRSFCDELMLGRELGAVLGAVLLSNPLGMPSGTSRSNPAAFG